MAFIHGALENEILNAVWKTEKNDACAKNISVSGVSAQIDTGGCKRAYTTIKTVMDRLVEKNLLVRRKCGKKFCHKSAKSKEKMAQSALNKPVVQYFDNDMYSLMKVIEKQCTGIKMQITPD